MTYKTLTHECDGEMSSDGGSGSERVSCDGKRYSDGTFEGGCGEPCSWIMEKSGHGKPPWGLKPAINHEALEAAILNAIDETTSDAVDGINMYTRAFFGLHPSITPGLEQYERTMGAIMNAAIAVIRDNKIGDPFPDHHQTHPKRLIQRTRIKEFRDRKPMSIRAQGGTNNAND